MGSVCWKEAIWETGLSAGGGGATGTGVGAGAGAVTGLRSVFGATFLFLALQHSESRNGVN